MVREDPERIRKRIAALPPGARAGARAAESVLAVADIDDGFEVVRGDLTIRFDAPPAFIRNRAGVVGVDALVRVFRAGVELEVDPHRVCVNPPTLVPDGTTHTETGPRGEPFEADNFREDPREAYLQWLESSIRTVPNPKGFRTRGTVTTVWATPPAGNEYITSTHTSDYSAAREGQVGFATIVAGSGALYVGNELVATDYYCYQGFVIFDTSGIADTESVTDVLLSLDGVYNGISSTWKVYAGNTVYDGGSVVIGDWIKGSELSGRTHYANWLTSGYSSGYNAFTSELGGAFAAAINKSGNTAIMLWSENHESAVTPTAGDAVGFTDADAAGTTTDPKIAISHSSIAFTALTVGNSATDGTVYTTASITPTANSLVLLAVASRHDGSDSTPTASGNGLTWVQVGTILDVSFGVLRMTLFRAMGASPSSGAITITFGTTQRRAGWSVVEFSGVDAGGANGSAAVVQVVTDGSASGGAGEVDVSLAAFGAVENATYGAVNTGIGAITPGVGFTEIHEQDVEAAITMQTQYTLSNDTVVDWLVAPVASTAAIAIEIKAFTGAVEEKYQRPVVIRQATQRAAIW